MDIRDLFGDPNDFPYRPDSPDFWELSAAVLRYDGMIEAAPADLRQDVWEGAVAQQIDVDAIVYLSTQRALRAIQGLGLSRDNAITISSRMSALYVEGFLVGRDTAGVKA